MSGSVSYPLAIPRFSITGDQQYIMYEYEHDVPPGLMTLTVYNNNTDERIGKVPAVPVGPRIVKALLPSISRGGVYSVVPMINHEDDPKFPPSLLTVYSPLQMVSAFLADDSHDGAMAATLAYVINNPSAVDIEDVDGVIADLLPGMSRKKDVNNISRFLSGEYYMRKDSFLCFALQHGLQSTTGTLTSDEFLQNTTKKALEAKNAENQTMAEVAANTNMQWAAYRIERHLQTSRADDEDDYYDYDDESGKKDNKMMKVGGKVKKFSQKQFGRFTKVLAQRYSKHDVDINSESGDGISFTLLEKLKATSLYQADIIEPYTCENELCGTIELKFGDVVYVTREDNDGMCTGIVNNKYCQFPNSILQEEDEVTMQDKEDLDSYRNQQVKALEREMAEETSHKKLKKNLSFLSPCTKSASLESGMDQIAHKVPISSLKPKAILPPPLLPRQPSQQVTPPPPLPPKDKAKSQSESKRQTPGINLQSRQPLSIPAHPYTGHTHPPPSDSDSEVDDPYDTIDTVPPQSPVPKPQGLVPKPQGLVPRLPQGQVPRQGPIIKPPVSRPQTNMPADSDSESDEYDYEGMIREAQKRAPPYDTRSAPCSPKVTKTQFVPMSSPQLQRKQQPVAMVPKPVAMVPKPAAVVPKPVAMVPKPVAMVPKPAAMVPKPAAMVPKPAAMVPKPVAMVPKPVATAPQPGNTSLPKRALLPPKPSDTPKSETNPQDNEVYSGDSVRNIIQRMNMKL